MFVLRRVSLILMQKHRLHILSLSRSLSPVRLLDPNRGYSQERKHSGLKNTTKQKTFKIAFTFYMTHLFALVNMLRNVFTLSLFFLEYAAGATSPGSFVDPSTDLQSNPVYTEGSNVHIKWDTSMKQSFLFLAPLDNSYTGVADILLGYIDSKWVPFQPQRYFLIPLYLVRLTAIYSCYKQPD